MGAEKEGRLTRRVRGAEGPPRAAETALLRGRREPAALVTGTATNGTAALDEEAPGVADAAATLVGTTATSLSDSGSGSLALPLPFRVVEALGALARALGATGAGFAACSLRRTLFSCLAWDLERLVVGAGEAAVRGRLLSGCGGSAGACLRIRADAREGTTGAGTGATGAGVGATPDAPGVAESGTAVAVSPVARTQALTNVGWTHG